MKAGEKGLAELLEGNLKEFVIPVFQRRYDWRKEQCQRLWSDLENVITNGFYSHFFGSIVSVVNHEPKKIEYLIIDGQQRITTVSLLFAAVCNLASSKVLSDPKELAPLIHGSYLIDKFKDDDNIRLRLNEQDYKAYTKIIRNDCDDKLEPCNVRFNYEYFVSQLTANKDVFTIDQLYQAIRSLSIVDIQLKQGEDDPQLIFESLNSTGLALSEADKIRNLVLMNLPYQKQKEYYAKFWQKIESHTSHNRMSVSDFARDFLTIMLRRIPRADQVYAEFKNYFIQTGPDTETVLSNMLRYSKYYQIILTCDHPDHKVAQALKALQRLENKVTYPYLMDLLDTANNLITSDESLARILRVLENFLFRRTICSVPTNALNKLFTVLEKEIERFSEWKAQYEAVFNFVLMNKQTSSRYPRDEEFIPSLMTRDIYNMHPRSKVYLLEELENFDSHHVVDVSGLLEKGEMTIEHIMPQTLTPSWQRSLEPNADEKHSKWLHTIGNLTLTAYNSKYSNRSFQEKLNMHNGFMESKLALNSFVMQCGNWGESEIEQRAKQLVERAAKRWPMIVTSFTPSKPVAETITLLDGEGFTFKQIQSFEFKGIEKSVESWRVLYEYILKTLFEQDPGLMTTIIQESDQYPTLKVILSFNKQALRSSMYIGDSIYAETNLDTNRKMQAVRDLLDAYGEDVSSLTITLKSTKSLVIADDEDSLEANNMSRGVTDEQWQDLIQDKTVFNAQNLRTLTILYEQPEKKQIYSVLADELGVSVSALNGQIVSLGKRIINKAGIAKQIRLDGSERFWNICFMAEGNSQQFTMILRPELIQAMETIGIGHIQVLANKATPTEKNSMKELYLSFWKQLLRHLYSLTDQFGERLPSSDSWMNFGSGISGLEYGFSITQKDCTVIFIMQRSERDENKRAFDYLESRRSEIEGTFGCELEWSRLDDKKASAIVCRLKPVDIRNEIQWPTAIDFMTSNLIRMKKTISPHISQVRKVIE